MSFSLLIFGVDGAIITINKVVNYAQNVSTVILDA